MSSQEEKEQDLFWGGARSCWLSLRSLLSQGLDQTRSHLVDNRILVVIVEVEDALDDCELSRCRVKTAESCPIVDNKASADDVTASVNGASCDRDLKKGGQLLLLIDRCVGVDQGTLVGQAAETADKRVLADRLSEDFDSQHISDDFLGLLINVWVHQGDVVVTHNHVAQSREFVFHALDLDFVRDAISDLEELLVCCSGGNKKAILVACSETPDDTAAGNGGLNNGDVVSEFALEDAVKVLGTPDRDEAVGVSELGKHPNLVVVLELAAGHGERSFVV